MHADNIANGSIPLMDSSENILTENGVYSSNDYKIPDDSECSEDTIALKDDDIYVSDEVAKKCN